MFEEFKSKQEQKIIVNLIVNTVVLSIIASIINYFSKSPSEMWVSALNIACVISIVIYTGIFNSGFKFYRWLVLSKKTSYKLIYLFMSIVFFILQIITNFIGTLILGVFNTNKIFIYFYIDQFLIILINAFNIMAIAVAFTTFILLLMTIVTRKILKKGGI